MRFPRFPFQRNDKKGIQDLVDLNSTQVISSTQEQKAYQLGTFTGVFTPTILSILGVIMFLRLSWVVGEAGVFNSIGILVIANIITFLTVLSASTIATNMRVKTGGGYYIISRILGLPVGSSVGLSLFLAQAFSVAFYTMGFAEAVVNAFSALNPEQIPFISLITLAFIFILAIVGADIALKSQYFIMVAIVLAIASFFMGILNFSDTNIHFYSASYTQSKGMSFWPVFAVFFPAVTGILGGISLSGDLKDPAKSIPKGAMLAVGISFLIYTAMIFGFAFYPSQAALKDSAVSLKIARWPQLVNVGIWGASLSSAIVSIVAAPRTLQALALDGIVPKFLGKGFGKKKEPVIALLITAAIGLAGIILGDLDFIAPILTMFFLITYGMLNVVVIIEKMVQNPSFRPSFKVSVIFPILGAIGSFGVMFLIDYIAGITAVVIVSALFILFTRKDWNMSWENIWDGFRLRILHNISLKLSRAKQGFSGKNWRPLILGFASNLYKDNELIKISSQIGQQKGITTLYYLVEQNFDEVSHMTDFYEEQADKLEAEIKDQAFIKTCVVKEVFEGVLTITQVKGIGELKYNTVLMGWVKDKSKKITYAKLIRNMSYLKKNLLILKENTPLEFEKRIDVWWGGKENNGKLMLLLAHLLSLHPDWKGFSISLKSIVNSEEEIEERSKLLEEVKRSMRIETSIQVLLKDEEHSLEQVIHDSSENARLVFIGIGDPEEGKEKDFIARLNGFLENLPTTLLVKCGVQIRWDEM